MAREKKIRVSEEELELIKEYRNNKYDETIPLGFVISNLVKDAN